MTPEENERYNQYLASQRATSGDLWSQRMNEYTQYQNGESSLWSDISGLTSQMREFAQQEYLIDKQNAYNAPAVQMARFRAAGINPQSATAAITGQPSVSAQGPAVPSDENGSAGALNALTGVGSMLGQGVENLASAGLKRSQKTSEDVFRNPTYRKLWLEGSRAAAAAGFDVMQARAIGAVLPYLGVEKMASIFNLFADFNNKKAEYDNIVKRKDEIIANTRRLEKEADYYIGLKDFVNADKLRVEAETRRTDFQNWYNEQMKSLFQSIGFVFDTGNPITAMINGFLSGNPAQAAVAGNAIFSYFSNMYGGQFFAEDTYAYSIAKRRQDGQNVSDSFYGHYGSFAQMIGDIAFRGLNDVINPAIGKIKGILHNPQSSTRDKCREIRSQLSDIREGYYDLLSIEGSDKDSINRAIERINEVLQFNDSELLDYMSKSDKTADS